MSPTLRSTLQNQPALAFGVSGVLASPLTSRRDVSRLVRVARDGGIALFDTAPAYGAGEGELRLGRALEQDRDAFVMTKVGVSAHGIERRNRDFRPAAIIESVEASLRRLRRQRLDLLWLHGPDPSELTKELLDALANLRIAGKIAHFGVAGHGEKLLAACQFDIFEAVMMPMHRSLPQREQAIGSQARASGRMLFGVASLSAVPPESRGLSRGAAWRALRWLSRRESENQQTPMTPAQAFDWAFDEGCCDVVVTTTSRRKRLEANIASCAHRRVAACGAFNTSAQ